MAEGIREMERASGIRRLLQSMLFPDLDYLLEAAKDLERRMGVLDKSLGVLDRSFGALDQRVDQLDKGMVQVDHGLNRLDKDMTRLSGGVDKFNKGLDQLNKDVDERERDLTVRLENLKAKLESDHLRAMGEVAKLFETHAFADRNPERNPEKVHEIRDRGSIQAERARAISELSAALGPQAPVEAFQGEAEPEPEHAKALHELASLFGSARRHDEPQRDEALREEPRELREFREARELREARDPMRDEPDRFAKANNGHPPPLDFAAILEHIRKREAAV